MTRADIARSEHVIDDGVTSRPVREPAPSLEDMVDAEGVDEEVFPTDEYADEVLGRVRVSDWMTPGIVQVEPDATLAHVCRRMLDEAIHRVFVVDRDSLVRVVSAEDVVRLLAEPAKQSRKRNPTRK